MPPPMYSCGCRLCGPVGVRVNERPARRSVAERVALELTEAVLTPNPFGERVNDEVCARASAHYDHKVFWTLTVAIGQMCFFIPVALIGKPLPGTEARRSK
jgi:alkylhydroperoxidase family enzyme